MIDRFSTWLTRAIEIILVALLISGIVWPAAYYGRTELLERALADTSAQLAQAQQQTQQVAQAYNQLVAQLQVAQKAEAKAPAASTGPP